MKSEWLTWKNEMSKSESGIGVVFYYKKNFLFVLRKIYTPTPPLFFNFIKNFGPITQKKVDDHFPSQYQILLGI